MTVRVPHHSALLHPQPALDKLTASLAARGAQIDAARASVNAVTDGIFAEFCANHGLSSVRDYEVAVVERGEADAKLKRTLTDTLTKLSMKLDYTRGCVWWCGTVLVGRACTGCSDDACLLHRRGEIAGA